MFTITAVPVRDDGKRSMEFDMPGVNQATGLVHDLLNDPTVGEIKILCTPAPLTPTPRLFA